jgi:predicted cobalt transporter CbtA
MSAYLSVSDRGSGAGSRAGKVGAGGSGGCATRGSAWAIRPAMQCSVQAALSTAAGFASSFCRTAWTRSSSRIAPCDWRIMLAACARHFTTNPSGIAGSWASRRQSIAWALAPTNCVARAPSLALAGNRLADCAMAVLSRRARSSGVSATGGGSAARSSCRRWW